MTRRCAGLSFCEFSPSTMPSIGGMSMGKTNFSSDISFFFQNFLYFCKYIKNIELYMASKEPGYVYILTNPSFREDWIKIGKTTNMEERLRTLYNTSLPLPFEPYATLKTVKYNEAEKLVHHYIERFTNLRIEKKREFFNDLHT